MVFSDLRWRRRAGVRRILGHGGFDPTLRRIAAVRAAKTRKEISKAVNEGAAAQFLLVPLSGMKLAAKAMVWIVKRTPEKSDRPKMRHESSAASNVWNDPIVRKK